MTNATLAQAILGPLADIAAEEELKQCIVVTDDGSVEALRWSGGITFLMNTVHVHSVVSLDAAVAAVCRSADDDSMEPTAQELFDPWMTQQKRKILLFTSRPLVELQAVLAALLHADVASTLIVASTIPERAHGPTFSFDTFGQSLLRGTSWKNSHLRVRYVPLLYAALLEQSDPRRDNAHPGLFVLTHPLCAPVFPLMRCHLNKTRRHHHDDGDASSWTHVQDISPQDIPESSRKAFKCLAHVLGSIMIQWQFDVKERIFALGATSLKIGHTLQHFLHELEQECTVQEVKSFQPATLVLVDRTCDLATPSSHQHTLLDRILQLLPRSSAVGSVLTRDHITEVAPLYATPSPSPSTPSHADSPSGFLSSVQTWTGGVGVCHPHPGASNRVFQSLAVVPPLLALRHLDKELREVAMDLLKQKLTPVPDKKADNQRGRDVILRWVKCVVDCSDGAVTWQHQELIQVALAVLETLERMEAGAEVAKLLTGLERDLRGRAGASMVSDLIEWLNGATNQLDVASLVSLCMYAMALAGPTANLDDETTTALKRAIMSTIRQNPTHPLLPHGLIAQLLDKEEDNVVTTGDDNWDDWGDDDDDASSPPPPSSHSQQPSDQLHSFLDTLVDALQECGQLFKAMPGGHSGEQPSGLLARLMALLIDPPSAPTIPKLQHVRTSSHISFACQYGVNVIAYWMWRRR
ncbi:hypothetical protein, variant [Aphanomyces astaci]|uniref:Uncharacterized protein n=1 Tax=Aphanomyces astaci TaxID=112090 RepID=W4H526_APHAT|nr:hypothetical protein, variant [Aphanomyces astaci]ETV86369.1 hypothetical protein, variant [Aphanomyces astaci]|eukprot:XP_009824841.1 hypothetical protein, variant [Aphanomyces astaci]